MSLRTGNESRGENALVLRQERFYWWKNTPMGCMRVGLWVLINTQSSGRESKGKISENASAAIRVRRSIELERTIMPFHKNDG